jgi:putative transposase
VIKSNLPNKTPSPELRLVVLSSLDHVPKEKNTERIKVVAERLHTDPITGNIHIFKERTIQTWYSRYHKEGIATIEKKTRSDKNQSRKITVPQLAEAVQEVLPLLKVNKVGRSLKSSIYRLIQKQGLIPASQMGSTTFYRMMRDNDILDHETCEKLRLSFCMKYTNEMWQADTMHGPSIPQAEGKFKKTFLIAFIDDASRVITHAQWFYADNTANMIESFRCALYKRGKPERLYFDNGSNYTSNEIIQACIRLEIKLSHAPIRDGAAKGKIERFFRGFRDRFLTIAGDFTSLDELNQKTQHWIEQEYNQKIHSGIGMIPIDRFNMDQSRITFICHDEYSDEVFFHEEDRKVNKTNCFTIQKRSFECPVALYSKKIQVRFDRVRKDQFIVYYKGKRMGSARPLDLHGNSNGIREKKNKDKS